MELTPECVNGCRIETIKVEIKWLAGSGWNVWLGKQHLGSTYGITEAVEDIAPEVYLKQKTNWEWIVVEGKPIDHWPFKSNKLVGVTDIVSHWAKMDTSRNCPHV